jgi:hypothetical protein
VLKARPAIPEQRGPRERQGIQGPLVLKVLRGILELPELREQQDIRELQGLKAQQELQGQQLLAILAQLGIQGQPVQRERQELQARLGKPAPLVLLSRLWSLLLMVVALSSQLVPKVIWKFLLL